MAKRVKFAVAGGHPLLDLVTKFLIEERKFHLIGAREEGYDFVLVGVKDAAWATQVYKDAPAFVLSDDLVYTIRETDGTLRPKTPMREDDSTVLSVFTPGVETVAGAVLDEAMWVRRKHCMLLRIFNVYGPDIKTGVVQTFVDVARQPHGILPVHTPGFQVRTFLYQEDFLECVSCLMDRFLEGTTGVFNVGSDEEVSIRRLADSVWQAVHDDTDTEYCDTKNTLAKRFWKVPDLTRTKAVAGWSPKTSLRKGIWRMVNEDRRNQ